MNKIDLLLQEKRRHSLKEEVSKKEKALLNKGIPIQKIMGFIDFDNLKIMINKNVLIPRYETQEVLHKALEFIGSTHSVLDLCCGSGYIGLTIKQKTGARVVLSDISDDAIQQTKNNAKANGLDVQVIKSNMFKSITQKFDVIVSNPPYIPNGSIIDASVINNEPDIALFAGEDGNDFYKIIISESEQYLNPNGTIIFEISEHNQKYIKMHGFKVLNDINKKPRIAYKTYK
ncbi:peptide chain release factor N(5)-glutamine methyltransferase [Candidatus Mycoplasma mahonii]|uniref:peptide chain release factor N(5)-glutamine methyltransferase n=1 Tax=Candidatus Mycoplasma mahonii TaxID=3004105 RepID=UPI0026EC86B6|nr:peptide chain release factor N(5)-glutamine methyltransferase [Candidatus Mycoplasma mahonii]WKX02493.1 peptide chain release factor N(5)-glutamine methyltransferase [Candidatus Mycoplasma mahonii]